LEKRIAIVAAKRTPFLRASTDFFNYDADDLAAFALK